MPESSFQPHAIIGAEGSPEIAPVYGYILRPLDARDAFFLTGYPEAWSVADIPARFGAANPQAFTPDQISHGDVVLTQEFSSQKFTVSVPFDQALLNPFVVATPTVPIEISVLRASHPSPAGQTLTWGVDVFALQIGIVETLTLSGALMILGCVPPPLHVGIGVPRLQFNRNCQHALYGTSCGAVRESFKKTGQIKMNECLPRKRQLVVDGIAGTMAASWFTGGLMLHVDSGQHFSIFASNLDTGKLTATLGHWDASFADDDEVWLYPGCRKTVADCNDKFSNKINYGGFAYIANRNPSIDSP